MMLLTVLPQAMLALALIAMTPVFAEPAEDGASAIIDVRVIQLASDVQPAQPADTDQETPERAALAPQRLTGGTGDVAVYLAPAGRSLRLAGHVWQSSDKSAPDGTRNRDWKQIAAPRIATLVARNASVRVGAQVPYMEARADGSLVVAYSDAIEGLVVEVNVGTADANAVLLDPLSVRLTRVVGREPIPNVPFDVGRPILRTLAASSSLKIAPDQVVIFELPVGPGEQPVFVLVQARLADTPS